MENGELLQEAEQAGYDVLMSTDKNIRYQQDLSGGFNKDEIRQAKGWQTLGMYLQGKPKTLTRTNVS